MQDAAEQTPIFKCIEDDDVEMFKYLDQVCHANIEASDEGGERPIYHAVAWRSHKIAAYLVDRRVNLNVIPKNNLQTPLIRACWNKGTEMVRILLQSKDYVSSTGVKLDVNLMDNKGMSALHMAV